MKKNVCFRFYLPDVSEVFSVFIISMKLHYSGWEEDFLIMLIYYMHNFDIYIYKL